MLGRLPEARPGVDMPASSARTIADRAWGARAASAYKIQHLGNEAGLPTLADIAAVTQLELR